MTAVDHQYYMQRAYHEALKAFDDGEVPVGAVVTAPEGGIIGRGCNGVERLTDATAHAEIIALGAAAASRQPWRLDQCTLYVTLEPCPMCLGAALLSRIGTIVYGAADPRLGAIDTFLYRHEAERSFRFFPAIVRGVMAGECGALLKSFFEKVRGKKN